MPRLPATDATIRCGTRPMAVTSRQRHRDADRQVGIHLAQERAHLRDRAGIAPRLDHKRKLRHVLLRQRHVDVWPGRIAERDELRVGGDADDSHFGVLAGGLARQLRVDADALSERLLIRPCQARERFVDDRDPRRRARVGVRKVASAHQPHPHRAEESWLDDIPVCADAVGTADALRPSWNSRRAQAHAPTVERQIDRRRRRLDPRHRRKAIEQLPDEHPSRLVAVARDREVERDDVDALLIEAGLNAGRVLERAQEEARGNHQQQRHRDLSDDEDVAQAQLRRGRFHAVGFQRG